MKMPCYDNGESKVTLVAGVKPTWLLPKTHVKQIKQYALDNDTTSIMSKKQNLKHAGNIGLALLLVCSLVYYCTINEYYKNDMASKLSMIVGSIIAMTISLFISYCSDLVKITKFISR